MKYLFIIGLLLTASIQAKTYDLSDRFGIGGGGGWTFPVHGNEFDDFAESELMWNLHLRYNTTPEDGLELNYNHLEFEDTDINARVLDLTYLYRINEGDKLTPILGIGAGVADMDNIEPFHDGLKFAGKARAGFEYAFTDDLLASVFVDYQYIGKMPFNGEDEDHEDEGIPGQEIFALIPQVGLTFFFGPDKEIEDDKKPAPAPAIIAPVERDDDLDGVLNSKDKCPGTARGKKVNAYGCMAEEKASMTIEVLFPSGGTTLGRESYSHLNQLADFLKEHPETKLEIQGHTDNTGTNTRNKIISEKRAHAVRSYLVERGGITPSRISAYGYGDVKPISDNMTEEGRSQNRRVIGVITQ